MPGSQLTIFNNKSQNFILVNTASSLHLWWQELNDREPFPFTTDRKDYLTGTHEKREKTYSEAEQKSVPCNHQAVYLKCFNPTLQKPKALF